MGCDRSMTTPRNARELLSDGSRELVQHRTAPERVCDSSREHARDFAVHLSAVLGGRVLGRLAGDIAGQAEHLAAVPLPAMI